MKERFRLSVRTHFSAAHHLRGYQGDCANPHGHNWMVHVEVSCGKLNELGMAMDFRGVKAALKSVLAPLDHADLNTLPEFRDQNPTSELVARHIYRELARKLNGGDVRVEKVTLDETPSYGVTYWEE